MKPTVVKLLSRVRAFNCKYCTHRSNEIRHSQLIISLLRIHSFEPQVCGDKQCPYDNLCVAQLAGYSADQCTAAPEECPDNDNGQCSGTPANPVNCGVTKQCPYENFCLAQAAGFDTSIDCCQSSRDTACTSDFTPVSCGAPAGKQCPYSNQCLAGKCVIYAE